MSETYLDKLLRKVAVTVQVIEDHGLSMPAKAVFVDLLLGFHNTNDGRCDPSAKIVGQRIGRHEKNVRTAITELEAAGHIMSRRRRGSSEYTFPGLNQRTQDRAILSDLDAKDRAISSARSGEIVLQDRAILPDKPERRTKRKNLGGPPQRGTRLSEDWQPSQTDIDMAIGYGLTRAQVDIEATKFRNHWIAKSGPDALKTSWERTWHNWIINTGKFGVAQPPLTRTSYLSNR